MTDPDRTQLMARPARWSQLAADEARATRATVVPLLARLRNMPGLRLKTAYAAAIVFALAGTVSLLSAGVGRPVTSAPPAVAPRAPVLVAEAAPADAGRTWAVTKVWQGSAGRETEEFAVSTQWRVDWLFAPAQSGAILQVFIYSAEGRLLMDLAANTQKGGADSSFWHGAGRYFLKVNASGGDWKLAVQELR